MHYSAMPVSSPPAILAMVPSCVLPSISIPNPSLLLRPQTLNPTPQIRCRFPSKPQTFSPPLHRPPPPLSYASGDAAAAAGAPAAAPAPAFHFEEIVEKDWSFLDLDPSGSSDEERTEKVRRVISAAGVRRDSRVLVSMGSAGFLDRMVESAPCELLVAVHESLFALALIKERHDSIRCWQGSIDAVPERFAPFDAVFLCYFPGMAASLDWVLSSLAARCSPGARVVVNFDQGKDIINQHQQQYPEMVTSDLPVRAELEEAATDHSFQITEFVDEPNFYLAVLRFCRS